MTTLVATEQPNLIRLHYLWDVAAAFRVMIAAIVSRNLWFLNWVHVFTGLMWTGIDLFMGFILGPILRRVDLSVRREVTQRLVPRTLFLMPTLAIITGTSGWYLAEARGFTELPWPQYAWVAAALALVVAMTVQGMGYLLPTNLRVCFELQKAAPDFAKISRVMRTFFQAVAAQGVMQMTIVVIMARFATGI
jgi:uncharacterized membrane protein